MQDAYNSIRANYDSSMSSLRSRYDMFIDSLKETGAVLKKGDRFIFCPLLLQTTISES
jgi:hypothetical protein